MSRWKRNLFFKRVLPIYYFVSLRTICNTWYVVWGVLSCGRQRGQHHKIMARNRVINGGKEPVGNWVHPLGLHARFARVYFQYFIQPTWKTLSDGGAAFFSPRKTIKQPACLSQGKFPLFGASSGVRCRPVCVMNALVKHPGLSVWLGFLLQRSLAIMRTELSQLLLILTKSTSGRIS